MFVFRYRGRESKLFDENLGCKKELGTRWGGASAVFRTIELNYLIVVCSQKDFRLQFPVRRNSVPTTYFFLAACLSCVSSARLRLLTRLTFCNSEDSEVKTVKWRLYEVLCNATVVNKCLQLLQRFVIHFYDGVFRTRGAMTSVFRPTSSRFPPISLVDHFTIWSTPVTWQFAFKLITWCCISNCLVQKYRIGNRRKPAKTLKLS